MTGVGVWALEDWHEASGPTWLIPGSHKFRRPPRHGENHPPGVPIEMPKGSVVFFSMQAVDRKLFEVLGRAERVLNVTTLDDFLAGNMPR